MMNTAQSRVLQGESPLVERVLKISRVSKVVKGGRHLRFNALVIVGDSNGRVGVGMGKAANVPDAVRKGAATTQKALVDVVRQGTTIPYEVNAKFGASRVMLKPASIGTGVIAGGAVRAVVELAGITDIVSKARGSTNAVNVTKAVFKALLMLEDPKVQIERRHKLAQESGARPVR